MSRWIEGWYLLRCREKMWRTTLNTLTEAKIETFCPVICEGRRRKDKKNVLRHVKSPVFPGYIFTRFNPECIHTTAILNIPGAMKFVRFGEFVSVVPDSVIYKLRCAEIRILHSDDISYECMYVTDEIINKIIGIYSYGNPQMRVSLLKELLYSPNKWLGLKKMEERNAA